MKSLMPAVAVVLFLAVAVYLVIEGAVVETPAVEPESGPGVAAQEAVAGSPDPVQAAEASAGQETREHAESALAGPPLQLTGQPDEPVGEAPNSWFEATDIRLGIFYQFEKAHGEFHFKNPSDQPRRFTNISHTCNCTSSKFHVGDREYYIEATTDNAHQLFRVVDRNGVKNPERVDFIAIGPGEEGTIEVEMEMSGTAGLKAAAVNLSSDDPEMPSVRLDFQAIGAAYFSIVPPEVNLNKMTWDESREFEVKVSSPVFDDFEITRMDTPPTGMKAEYERTMENGKPTYVIKGTYGPVDSTAGGGGNLVFYTNQRGLSVTVPVMAIVEGPLTIEPASYLSMGRIKKDTSVAKTVTFTPAAGFDLQVEKLEWQELSFDEDHLKVTSKKNDAGAVEVTVEILPGVPAGTVVRGEVLVHLNHPAARSESILFNGFVR